LPAVATGPGAPPDPRDARRRPRPPSALHATRAGAHVRRGGARPAAPRVLQPGRHPRVVVHRPGAAPAAHPGGLARPLRRPRPGLPAGAFFPLAPRPFAHRNRGTALSESYLSVIVPAFD